MKNTLRLKLSLSYILVALVCVLIISIMTNGLLENQFGKYMVQNQERKNIELTDLISKLYNDNGTWNNTSIEKVGVNAIEQGLIIKITDISHKVIWDAATHNSGLCKQMLDDMIKNSSKYYHNWNGKYLVREYPLYSKAISIGTLEIGYYGPFYYNSNDFTFIDTLNKYIIWVGIFSLLFAFALGSFMAKWLTTPIARVIKT